VLEIREALYDVLLAELGSADVDARAGLDVLQRHWAGAIGRATLSLTVDGGTGDRLHIGTDPRMVVADRLADAASTCSARSTSATSRPARWPTAAAAGSSSTAAATAPVGGAPWMTAAQGPRPVG
jgi:hypothetical protein